VPGYMNPMPGRGWGMGRGRGWGRGRGRGFGMYPWAVPGAIPAYGVPAYYAGSTAEPEMQALRTQAEQLEGTLNEIRKRIAELEAAQQKEN